MTQVRIFHPSEGQAFQGDVMIMPLPADFDFRRHDCVDVTNGMLSVSEGEALGHHHAFRFNVPISQFTTEPTDAELAEVDLSLIKTAGGSSKAGARIKETYAEGSVKMFHDPVAIATLVERGILTTDKLAVGLLEIGENAPPLTHDEHEPIQFPPGLYYAGRKREQNRAEEQIVQD